MGLLGVCYMIALGFLYDCLGFAIGLL
jgi:hypothetical protein